MIQKIIYSLSGFRDYFIFLCCIIFSTVLLFSQNHKQVLSLRAAGADLFSSVEKKFAVFTNSFHAVKDNVRLNDQYQILLRRYQALENLQWENRHLLDLLDYKKKIESDHVLGKVIGMGTYQNTRYIKLDVGSKDGVKKNHPVVSHKGLVGKIFLVGENSSMCQTIADKNFGLSVRDMKTRTTGIMKWNSPGIAQIFEIPKQDHIDLGDRIITSGFSEIFPPGINLGKVVRIDPGQKDELTKLVFVELSENLRDLEFVFVIMYQSEKE